MQHPKLEELIRRDPRYPQEAYQFVYAALAHTQLLLRRRPKGEAGQEPEVHVSGRELLEGIRDLAQREFGLLARTVFRAWGINRTDDFGEIVFNLVEAGLMTKTADDCRQDFQNVYDLDRALVDEYRIVIGEDAENES